MTAATNPVELAYYISFFQNANIPKIAAMKRVGPRSLKFKTWKHEVEDALITLLGRESLAIEKFGGIDWPEHKGIDFNDAVDEAKIILDTAVPHILLKNPALKSFDPVVPKGPFPVPLEHVISEIELCLKSGAFTAASVMIRKAVEVAVILRFQQEGRLDLVTSDKGDTLSFTEKIDRAQGQNYLSPQRAKELKQIKSYGDSGAHSDKIVINQDDIQHAMVLLRLSLGELFPESQRV
jgi:hypothetical protein